MAQDMNGRRAVTTSSQSMDGTEYISTSTTVQDTSGRRTMFTDSNTRGVRIIATVQSMLGFETVSDID
jgi:hypothetical protein